LRKDIKISSVTLNWNGQDVLPECIQSLKSLDLRLYEIIVVDNNSEDGSIEILKRDFPDVVVIQNERNFGAPRGRNVGLKRALEKPIDYVFTLDNDLFADSKCLSELVSLAEQYPDIGTICAFVYDANNPRRLLSAGGIVDYTQNVSRPLIVSRPDESLYGIDFCGTGHMLTRRKVFDEIGLLDETFIGYGFEDTDFGFRVRRADYRVCACPAAKVWHRPHSNIGSYTFRKKYLESRNAVVFMRRYATFQNWVKYLFFAVFGLPYAFISQGLMKGNVRGVWGKAKGLYDGFFGREDLALEMLNTHREKRGDK